VAEQRAAGFSHSDNSLQTLANPEAFDFIEGYIKNILLARSLDEC
jgi:hypothetical protein